VSATFGDLALAGREHLDFAITLWQREPTAEIAAGIMLGIRHTAEVMLHCAHDTSAATPVESGRGRDADVWWRAAADTESGLRTASAALTEATGHLNLARKRKLGSAGFHIYQAGQFLAAARDLLQTHRTASPETGTMSDWPAVFEAPEFAGALLTELAGWSKQIADLFLHLAKTDPLLPSQSERLCLRTYRGFQAVVDAAERAAARTPVSPGAAKLLHNMRSTTLPARRQPSHAEPMGELCRQAMASAQRIRAAARRDAGQANWSPAISSESWQWMAEAASIISHLASQILATIGGQDHIRHQGLPTGQMHSASLATASAHAGWQQVAWAWDAVTTETSGLASPAIADMTDLVLRLGRITFDNPLWTPARMHRAPLRKAADLAPNPGELAAVVATVHEAIDTLACVASADRQAVELAYRAWRLHVPTRCLRVENDIPHSFGPATNRHLRAIQQAYNSAVTGSTDAAMTLEVLVLVLQAPSTPLATARRLSRPTEPVLASGHSATGSASLQPKDLYPPGPTVKNLLRLGVTDPFELLQAMLIDHAGRALVDKYRGANSKEAKGHNRHPAVHHGTQSDRYQADSLHRRPTLLPPGKSHTPHP